MSPRSLAVILLVALGACQDAGDGKKEDAPSTTREGTSDELVVVESVPMGLVQSNFFSRLEEAAGDQLGRANYASLEHDRGGVAASDPLAPGFAFATELVRTPVAVTGELLGVIREIQRVYDEVLKSGPLAAAAVEVAVGRETGVGQRDFAFGNDLAVRLKVDRGTEPPYTLEIYRREGGRFARGTEIKFGKDAPALALRFKGKPETDARTLFLEARYEPGAQTISTTFGKLPVKPTQPARTSASLALVDESSVVESRAAFIWRRPAAASAPNELGPPRHYAPQDGDIETFSLAARLDQVGAATQLMAFLPAADVPGLSPSPPSTIFGTHGYDKEARRFTVDLVRLPGTNEACATAGEKLREAFAGKPLPAVVAALPSDLCRANAAVADDAVFAAVSAACGVPVKLELTVKVKGGATRTVALCDRQLEADILANPQYLVNAPSGQTKLLVGDANATPTHLELGVRAGAGALPSLAGLAADAWFDVPTLAAAELGMPP